MVPTPTPVIWPAVAAALDTVAMVVSAVVHATCVVTSCLVPFWYVAVAVSGELSPRTKLTAGPCVMAIDTMGDDETVTEALPVTPESAACTWAVPTASAVAVPCCPAAFDTATAVVLVDDQVAEIVTSAVLLSE